MKQLQDLVWLWMLLAFTILPAVQALATNVRRNMLIQRIEQERGTKVVRLIHRQASGILGALLMRYIDLDDSERILKEIRAAGDRPIDLVIHTPGGLVIASEQIARALAAHGAGVTAIVPQYALSGGTLLAIAADQILMDHHAMLGPIDPQLGGRPASSYLRVLREKELNAVQDQTIMMADMAAKATAQLEQTAFGLLKNRLGEQQARVVATMLTEGRWTHDYPLHVEELRAMGLPVSDKIPEPFRELLGLSSAAQQRIMRKAEEKQPEKA